MTYSIGLLCPSDAELEAHVGVLADASIAAHLDDCIECTTVVAAMVVTMPPEPEAGDTLGRYRLLRELGRGGMGVVFEAKDVELDREVAIKVVRRRGGADLDLDARLRRESRLLARIHDPAVITIYDVGRSADCVFIAMELVRGTTLKRWVAAGERGWREVLDVVHRAARGLAAAHDAGVLHRDIKPDNILIEDRGGRVTRVVVSDFGVARLFVSDDFARATSELPVDEVVTIAGDAPGTLAYMAPEQLDGGPIDARADVFALAVTAWQALFGARPFAGRTKQELQAAIAAGPKREKPSRAPARVERVLRRALVDDVDRRTPTVHELARQLRAATSRRVAWIALAAGLAVAITAVGLVLARGDERTECSTAALDEIWPSGSPRAVASGVDTLVANVDRMVVAWRAQRAEQCEIVARGEQADAARVDCLDRWVHQLAAELDTLAPATPGQSIVLADPGTCRNAPGVLRLYVDLDPARQREVQRVRRRMHDLPLEGDPRAALAIFESDVERLDLAGPRNELALLRTQLDLELDASVLRALASRVEREGDDQVAAHAWLDLVALVLGAAPDPARTKDLMSIADAAVRRLGNPLDLQLQWSAMDARLAALEGDAARVRRAADKIQRLASRDDVRLHAAVASSLLESGDASAAIALISPVIERIRAARSRGNHAGLAYGVYGNALLEVGRVEEGRDALTAALEISIVLRPDHVSTSARRIELVRAYITLGDHESALAELERARAGATAPTAPIASVASYHEHRSQVLAGLGRKAEAVEAMRAAVAAYTSSRTSDPKSVALARVNLASMTAEAGDHRSALVIVTSGLAELEAAMGDANPHVANGYAAKGEILVRLKRLAEARVAFEKAVVLYAKLQADPAFVAVAKFGLARTLPAGDPRARVLANEALAAWRAQPNAWRPEIADVEAWLRVLR